jgi:DNA topoisomerase IA
MKIIKRVLHSIGELIEFRSRIWVVYVEDTSFRSQSYVVNEDGFNEPLQWMKNKGYCDVMLQDVEEMRRSQIKQFQLGKITHHLTRVK